LRLVRLSDCGTNDCGSSDCGSSRRDSCDLKHPKPGGSRREIVEELSFYF
jgi:hypothetical protein